MAVETHDGDSSGSHLMNVFRAPSNGRIQRWAPARILSIRNSLKATNYVVKNIYRVVVLRTSVNTLVRRRPTDWTRVQSRASLMYITERFNVMSEIPERLQSTERGVLSKLPDRRRLSSALK